MVALTAIIEIALVTNRNPTTNCVALKFFWICNHQQSDCAQINIQQRKLECFIACTNGNSKIENDLVKNYVYGSISNSSACSS